MSVEITVTVRPLVRCPAGYTTDHHRPAFKGDIVDITTPGEQAWRRLRLTADPSLQVRRDWPTYGKWLLVGEWADREEDR